MVSEFLCVYYFVRFLILFLLYKWGKHLKEAKGIIQDSMAAGKVEGHRAPCDIDLQNDTPLTPTLPWPGRPIFLELGGLLL